jgi:hypothetical protein
MGYENKHILEGHCRRWLGTGVQHGKRKAESGKGKARQVWVTWDGRSAIAGDHISIFSFIFLFSVYGTIPPFS